MELKLKKFEFASLVFMGNLVLIGFGQLIVMALK